MSLIEDIAQLMLREGEIKGQSAREQIAAEEERRQAKHRVLKNTLKFLATYGPMFIPGVGPIAGPLISAGVNQGLNAYSSHEPEFLDPSQNPTIGVWHR